MTLLKKIDSTTWVFFVMIIVAMSMVITALLSFT